jgi:hypothetical protein
VSYCRVDRQGRLVQQSTTLSGLGFSLKPPKFIRKFQPGIFIQKHALPIAAIGASFLIPGVAPLAAKGILGAGRLVVGGARGVVAGARGLFNLAHSIKTPKLPQYKLPTAQYFAPVAPVPQQQMIPVSNPTLGPSGPVPAGMAASGGGGDLVGPPAPDASSAAAPAQAGMGAGALMVGALVLGGMMLAKPKRKR